ncbi:hypothetical protein [Gracilimonas sp.]|uniref:hypothetical protein n=1 Tax=Gracilimonas sp. TaxID=1974203 RepID=UPI002870C393|nr:hypothetical protein [Gracilimonas sp.]
MSFTLTFKKSISKRKAVDKIFMIAKFSDHNQKFRPETKEELQRYFLSQGYNTDQLIESIRNSKIPVPIFENFIGSTWKITGGSFKQKIF